MRRFAITQQQRKGVSARRRRAVRMFACAAGFGVLCLAAGCTSSNGPMFSNLPQALGGLPADAPARPVNDQTGFPAVHDMPPPRTASTLSPEQVKAVETEIDFARQRQKVQAKAQAPGASTPETEER